MTGIPPHERICAEDGKVYPNNIPIRHIATIVSINGINVTVQIKVPRLKVGQVERLSGLNTIKLTMIGTMIGKINSLPFPL
ncbi:hypothetical protein HYN56_04525 [Flavobacterium crocinum]|uniref:Uncharacterized protein n=1 Tax=Flavobacterium crocinum TaxID=2183896 RepID=A0A2S1YHL0_9FLAO|nr:hypothetical protein HYN56_04525 [Flavobacterium crocinum]